MNPKSNLEESLKNPSLFVLVGPSGAGKTSILDELAKDTSKFGRAITHTTRQPRAGEVNGKDYHFVSVDEFKKLNYEDGFAETAEVHGNFYGTSKKALKDVADNGLNILLIVDFQGVKKLQKAVLPVPLVPIYIAPPSIDELKKRMEKRGTIGTDLDVRLKNAIEEIEFGETLEFKIVNMDLAKAITETRNLIQNIEKNQIQQNELKISKNKFKIV